MKSLKIQLSGLILAVFCLMIPLQSMAQWSIGVSYEKRDADPQNGFGVRVERSILNPVPIVDIGLRAHFSYFSENNKLSQDNQNVSGDFTVYDYGLAATGGFSLGLFKPYVGLGIGNSTAEFSADDNGNDYDDSKVFWNSFVGAELTVIPKLHPFVEYRFQPTDEAKFADNFNSDGRFILGLSLSF